MATPDVFVTFTTPLGEFVVDLYAEAAPRSVENFIRYIPSYQQSGEFFHRLVSGFVLQGGGYRYVDAQVQTNAQFSPVVNEFSSTRSNVTGTIAYAKLGGDPNSATNQFFFNLGDNAANLDNQNGGFTVFGRVVQGWDVVARIAALPVVNAGSPFDQLPVINFTSGTITASNLATFSVRVTSSLLVAPGVVAGVVERLSLAGSALVGAADPVNGDVLTVTAAHAGSAADQTVGAGGLTLTGAYGRLTLQRNGAYTYTADVEGLVTGARYTDDFVVTVADQHNNTVMAPVRFTVTGSATGNAAANIIVGSAEGDVITGGGGADTLTGGGGADTFVYTAFADSVAAAVDTITDFTTGADRIDLSALGPGTVDIGRMGAASTVSFTGSNGAALVIAVTGEVRASDVVSVAIGASVITGTSAGETLTGTSGADSITGRGGADTLTGGAGADTFVYGIGDSVSGASDVITDFESGVDRLDLAATSPTATSLVRSGGNTVIFSQGSSGPQTQVLVNGTTIQGGDLLLVGAGLDMVGQDNVADLLIGGAGPDTLFGLGGSDTLQGGAGDDRLFGDAGGDILAGGAGADRFAYRGFADSNAASGYDIVTDFVSGTDKIDLFFLNGLQTVALVRSNGGTFVFANTSGGQVQVGFTGAVQGTDLVNPSGTAGSFGYDLLGEGGNETLVGSAGNDTLFGFAGTDTLQGGAGDDALFGDAGGDILTGGAGVDRFSYRGVSDSNATTGYDIVTDFVSGTDKIDLFFLNGLQTVSLVRSNGGTFLFAATSGGQVQVGFTGAVQGSDLINPSGTAAAFGYDMVGEAAAETLIGSGGNDVLFGLGGNDTLSGGGGGDILYGDAGGDLLTGGAGLDIFSYRALSDSVAGAVDRIVDFQVGLDKLDLRGVHASAADRYGYVLSGADTILFYDAGGDGVNDMQIVLAGVTTLQASDILF